MNSQLRNISTEGLDLIKSFEGCQLVGYLDVGGVPTIGYGTTGSDVYEGMHITAEEAEKRLVEGVKKFTHGVLDLVTVPLAQNQLDALVSFAYNVGLGALEHSTLLKLLNKGADLTVVSNEFLRWNKVMGVPFEGLTRRRQAEQQLFLGRNIKKPVPAYLVAKQDTWLKRRPVQSSDLAPEEKLFAPKGAAHEWLKIVEYPGEAHKEVSLATRPEPTWWFFREHWDITDKKVEQGSGEIRLSVPYYSQRDNETDPTRTCFSSSCAMMLKYLRPSSTSGDDEYIKEVYRHGDSTESSAQIAALHEFGLVATFHQDGSWTDIDELLLANIPVPIGILHKGPVTAPSGGGHWITVIGRTEDKTGYIVHDPWGELDLVGGTYVSTNGNGLRYSKKNLGKRWLIENSYSGWYMRAKA